MAKDDNPTKEHLEAVSEQVESRHGGAEVTDAGPDPIIEATKDAEAKANEEAKKRLEDEPPAYINPKSEGLSDEEIKANEEKARKQQEVGESNWDDVVSGANPDAPEDQAKAKSQGDAKQKSDTQKKG